MAHHHAHHHHDAGGHHHHDGILHTHAPAGKMGKAFVLTCAILVVELIGGMLSHSLALMSDAGHVLTDVFAIGLSWFAIRQSVKPADESMTFGYARSGILAAQVNGLTLIVITLWILVEAYRRLQHPSHVHSLWMFISATVGICVNLYLALGMRHEENLNVKSAVLHMLGDAAASAGVLVAGIIISFTHWYIVDPLLSIAIAVLIAFGAWRIVRQTMKILMEGTPQTIDFRAVVDELKALPGIQDVHDVHVWAITSGQNALSCHAVLDGNMTIRDSQQILRDAEHSLSHFGIGHVTIQIEDGSHPHENRELCSHKEDVLEHHHH
ncbi:cation diffusion facilitator family transporter [Alicyclobacillus fastidiosus]|uniref:Cation diffusion facilitator family transporter n=1 Tax=Alicyclobacillus fastidiosus TaxID=392011 RepID=A0ABY6ZN63_9BACL|nr:cation diffusion facilitator family transporter [Alicyclobacillus fastidiosus]WAH43882.1 cation diffusion facilitator family transporter [Alicyclobacillus fastidiosus]GMA60124.1 cadmium, cobalt and zinc/H(+)-K(+) antiporter [Alicyclobacillus fastidiosus]